MVEKTEAMTSMSNMMITMMRSRLKTTSKVQVPTRAMEEVASKQVEAEDKAMRMTMKSQEEFKEEVATLKEEEITRSEAALMKAEEEEETTNADDLSISTYFGKFTLFKHDFVLCSKVTQA